MQDLKALETRKIALYRRLNALALELPESIHSDIITHCDAYIQALTERETTLVEAIKEGFTEAYNNGVAAGILKDKADHCFNAELKKDYLERMGFYQNEFKELHRKALVEFTPPTFGIETGGE